MAGYGGEPRNPVVLPRAQWSLADSLVGDQGLSQVVRAAPHRLVDCGELGSVADVDRPGDLPREWS
ncbi:MAG: hypothetical protein U0R64_00570 [Candidatus Nanopelagicales bacterium]